ncbi:MAG: DUF58 domain-containing protein [Cellulosimicrobium funkei]|uniref:DUF58 domain-containing protein n=3 Tax=Cellulosimicrobium cellulans TaxID=1710 RepID=A0AAV5P394_CELCE|nr:MULTISPECIES: DUF58 domain-containing protein [Cellulosimicrobium]KFD43354.1 hypothetical protein IU11_12235 [Cellulosimicrobium sp. MM]QDP74457.1 DUF58 domain-containing protein [Cellulosimicrobium cellulans]GLY55671.1 hypothetical protein Ccel01_02730 [Cellulosimicrobium cellulans]
MPDVSRLAQVRARLDLPVARRASGLLEGRHRSVFKGHGQDFDDLHLYAPGEDVGDIDWKSSARAGLPIIRRFVRESNLNLVLVVDTGRTMGATAPSGETKAEIASFCCALVAYLARDRGDRVALVAGDAERLVQLPPRASTRDLEVLLRTVEGLWRPDAPGSDLSRPLDRAQTAFRRRSLVVVVTDEARPAAEHEQLLRSLRVRHEVMVVQVADLSPVGAGTGEVADVDGTLRLPPFLRGRAALAAPAAEALAARRSEVAERLRALQVEGVLVEGSDDVLQRFVELLGRQKRARR